jgi:tubulin---tyrosine ligase
LRRKARNGPTLIYSKLEENYHLANKKALFMNISNYYRAMGHDPFEVAIPLTFHIKSPNDPEYKHFIEVYQKEAKASNSSNIWIIKPGENSNRGVGIQVADQLGEIRSLIHSMSASNGNRTTIVQKYIERPLLISGRKFDIRAFAMITSINGCLKGYMYRDCYFRTSCKPFDLTNLGSRYVHLTNDAVQMNSEDYGKFENGNKLSINDF